MMAVMAKEHRAAAALAEVGVTRVAAVAATLILAITIQSTLLASATHEATATTSTGVHTDSLVVN